MGSVCNCGGRGYRTRDRDWPFECLDCMRPGRMAKLIGVDWRTAKRWREGRGKRVTVVTRALAALARRGIPAPEWLRAG